MGNQIIINPGNSNQVEINQGQISVVDVITQGPQGPVGPQGPSGSGGTINTSSFVTTSSFNAFTGSYNTGSFTGSFTGSLLGSSSYATTASYVLNFNSSSFATTGSNTFIGDQFITGSIYITGSLQVTGSITADNLWYRYTLINLPLDTAGTYTIVPVTPGYKFVQAYYVIGSTHIPINTSIENNSNSSITISNPIRLGTPSDNIAIWKFDNGSLGANEVFSKWGEVGSNVMIDISTDPIIVTVDGSSGDTGVIDVTVTGYLKKI